MYTYVKLGINDQRDKSRAVKTQHECMISNAEEQYLSTTFPLAKQTKQKCNSHHPASSFHRKFILQSHGISLNNITLIVGAAYQDPHRARRLGSRLGSIAFLLAASGPEETPLVSSSTGATSGVEAPVAPVTAAAAAAARGSVTLPQPFIPLNAAIAAVAGPTTTGSAASVGFASRGSDFDGSVGFGASTATAAAAGLAVAGLAFESGVALAASNLAKAALAGPAPAPVPAPAWLGRFVVGTCCGDRGLFLVGDAVTAEAVLGRTGASGATGLCGGRRTSNDGLLDDEPELDSSPSSRSSR